MRIAAISSLFLAAAASIVSAAPVDDESTERLSYNDTKAKPAKPRRANDGWIEIASPTPASHGEEHIPLEAGAASFSRLRIDAASGRSEIRAVRIYYKNGKTKLTRVDRVLDHKRQQSAVIDLKPVDIDQVVVITSRDSRGSYSVFGEPAHASVASR